MNRSAKLSSDKRLGSTDANKPRRKPSSENRATQTLAETTHTAPLTQETTHTARVSSRRLFLGTITSGLVTTFSACSIPNLRLPRCFKETPNTYEETTAVALTGNTPDSSAQIPWCEFFNDPILVELISQALVDNQELKILAEDIRIAQYEVQARSGAYLPFGFLGGGAGIDKASRFTRAGAVEDQLLAAPGKGFPKPLPDFLISTNIIWEIDIWKKLRNAQAAAAYRYLGTREGRNFVVTRLIADIASNYYKLLALDNQLQILDLTINIQQKSLETASALKAAGRGSELGVQRFEAEVRRIQSEKLLVQQEIIRVENEINFAAGRFPQRVERQAVDFINLNLNALSLGVPSQLLQNRADIRQAERQLTAAGLDVKVARARFYPSLILTAGVGYEAFNTRYLLSSPESLIYGAAGELVGPIINRRAIKADYQTANAEQLQAVYTYQQKVLNAFIEVINYITAVENLGKSIEIKKQQLAALEKSVSVAGDLFKNPPAEAALRVEYIDVLLAQREFMEAKTVLIKTKQDQLNAIVNTYQALGGGSAPTRTDVPFLSEASDDTPEVMLPDAPEDANKTPESNGEDAKPEAAPGDQKVKEVKQSKFYQMFTFR